MTISNSLENQYFDSNFFLQMIQKLESDAGAIPLVCKRWHEIIYGSVYTTLFNEKKPFGYEEWIKHFKIKPAGVPVIPIAKLLEFDPTQGRLTLIVTRYTEPDSDKVMRLTLSRLFSQIKHEDQSKSDSPYKFTVTSLRSFFGDNSPYRILRSEPTKGNYWFYSESNKCTLPFRFIDQIFNLPHKHKKEMEGYLPTIFATVLTFITHYARTGSYSLGAKLDSKPIVVKESADLRILPMGNRLINGSKLSVSFSEEGISVKTIDTFRANIRDLTIVPFEYYGIKKPE